MDHAPLDRIFAALADPARRAMIEQLCTCPRSVKELAQPMGMRLPSALKHLKVLEAGGLVVSRKAGRVRTYQISPSGFSAIDSWIAQRQAALRAAFDRLDRAIAEFPDEDRT